ncbi:KOW domain-containing RNA-binding protein [Proteiniborus sp.]|uniref:KOW domain-containing RNA-binding protein n=1 Tax=Proteiniborus sp. TaxID=2079015 RepID=UPI003321ED98
METTSDIHLGQVVRSKAGRDKGKVFVVLDIVDDEYVLISDGDYRRIDSPKKKKIKHLIVYKTIIEDLNDKLRDQQKINNAYIRKALDPFYKEI